MRYHADDLSMRTCQIVLLKARARLLEQAYDPAPYPIFDILQRIGHAFGRESHRLDG